MKLFIKIVAVLALLIAGAGYYTKWANRDITELTQARYTAFKQIQPVMFRFKTDNGHFPQRLEELVPKYLPAVPGVLVSVPEDEAARQIQYESKGETARFSYHIIRGPDSTEVYDVVQGNLQRNQ